ncbi:MAG: WD40 repeat domain-containing protein [Nocardioidaceae bacterium]|nr:WD40 repeat domain-containing protein [Nocardioidaceae bacterium]
MSDLKNRLDDLLAAVPTHVVPDDLAARARSAGTRRRRVRRVGVVAVVVAAVAVVLALGRWPHVPFRPPIADLAVRADGYPTRIDHVWFERALPDAPGPIAGLVRRDGGGPDDDRSDWWAVSERGSLRRLPVHDFFMEPSLSPSGRRLAVFSGPAGHAWDGRLQLWDLVGGKRVTVDPVGGNLNSITDKATYWMADQQPGFWSPDDQHLVLSAHRWDNPNEAGVVVSWDGTVTAVPELRGTVAWPVGWLSSDRIAWLGSSQRVADQRARLFFTDLEGRVTGQVTLARAEGLDADELDQWSGSISPDGTRVALRADGSGASTVLTFDAATGALIERWPNVDLDDVCALGWQGDQVVAPLPPGGSVRLVAPDDVLVRADPVLGASCSYWAADALAGTPHRDLVALLTHNSAWAPLWWWREAVLGLLALVLLGWGGRWARRRRTRSAVAP